MATQRSAKGRVSLFQDIGRQDELDGEILDINSVAKGLADRRL
jgi:hypothetical protein